MSIDPLSPTLKGHRDKRGLQNNSQWSDATKFDFSRDTHTHWALPQVTGGSLLI